MAKREGYALKIYHQEQAAKRAAAAAKRSERSWKKFLTPRKRRRGKNEEPRGCLSGCGCNPGCLCLVLLVVALIYILQRNNP